MLVLPTFLIFVSLSVAAIPLLGSRPNGQPPHIRRLLPAGLPDLPLPAPAKQLLHGVLTKRKFLRRFIMGADYASSSGPFLGKSPHKRQDPISETLGSTALRASDLKDELSPNLSPRSAPT
jgi:hypothetical protein